MASPGAVLSGPLPVSKLLKGVNMVSREIMEKSLEEDHFSSHTHEVDLFAKRVAETHGGNYTVPECYGLDRCALMMVNPQRLFFYWEISSRTKQELGMGDDSVMELCVMREEERIACEEVRGDIGSYYLAVFAPFSVLYALLLWTGPDGKRHVVLRSKKVTSFNDRYPDGELWMDKNGIALMKASLNGEGSGSSEGIISSVGLHVRKENQ